MQCTESVRKHGGRDHMHSSVHDLLDLNIRLEDRLNQSLDFLQMVSVIDLSTYLALEVKTQHHHLIELYNRLLLVVCLHYML